jgi:hypothetical protein
MFFIESLKRLRSSNGPQGRPHHRKANPLQLTKQMYRNVVSPGLFGLSGQQMRDGAYVHNPGWYNGHGAFLGWGDLSWRDIARIAREIDQDETFVIMDEQDWRSMSDPVLKDRGYEQVPVSYLAQHAIFLVRRGKAYWRRAIYSQVAGHLSGMGLCTQISGTEQSLAVIDGTFS